MCRTQPEVLRTGAEHYWRTPADSYSVLVEYCKIETLEYWENISF